MRLIALAATVLLAGCASFSQPMYPSAEAEQEACLRSAWCRAVIDDRPSWVFRYRSTERDCMAFAADIAEQAQRDGRRVGFVFGTVRGSRHVVAVVDGWVVDNGGLGAAVSVFHESEIDHWMTATETFR